jgi:hypothetical protein
MMKLYSTVINERRRVMARKSPPVP